MPVILLAATMMATTWSLWARRSSLRCKWEGAPTLAVICAALSAYLTSTYATPLGAALHIVTGMWNLEDWAGHQLLVVWACAAVYMGLVRFADGATVQAYYTQWVTRPVIVTLALMQVTWAASPAGETSLFRFEDLGTNPWIMAYWTFGCALVIYLLTLAGRIVWRLRAIRSTLVLNMYLTAFGTMILCLLTAQLQVTSLPHLQDLPKMIGCVSVILLAITAGRSWHIKLRAEYVPDVPPPVDSDADRVRGKTPFALGDSGDS